MRNDSRESVLPSTLDDQGRSQSASAFDSRCRLTERPRITSAVITASLIIPDVGRGIEHGWPLGAHPVFVEGGPANRSRSHRRVIGESVKQTAVGEGKAKRFCAGCPVRTECLRHALQYRERFGVWGGLTEYERYRAMGMSRDPHGHRFED